MATMMMTTSRTATTATATTTPTDELIPPETEVWFPFVGINDESPPVMWCICDDFLMVESHYYIMSILPPVAASSIV